MNKWNSIRITWPENAGQYEVKDCQHDVLGTSYYDGYQFKDPKFKIPVKGNLLLITYTITHWREQKNDNN